MPSSAPSSTLKKVLAECGTFSSPAALVLCRQLLRQVRALHAAGITHRAIGLEAVLVDARGRATLTDPEAVQMLDGEDAGSDGCPPELAGVGVVRVPADIDAARHELSRAGIALDPRRLDVYQLGALLCQVLTGESVSRYLCSPKARSRVPAPLRPLIDRALGHNPADRLTDGAAFAKVLEALAQPAVAAPPTPPGVVAASADTVLPFTRLAHYRVDRLLGHGGMGDVYLGYEEALLRPVAIKVLPAELARDEELVRRFQTEATTVARLAHPNLVSIHFIGQDAGCHFFVMQYVEGESLQSLLARKGRLEVEEAVGILEQCLVGLGTAHQAGLVHRDVKPGNILLDRQTGRALVTDFGLVKTFGSSSATGKVLGTLDYIAPEQVLAHEVDTRADLYALGVVAYQMLSGRLPFQTDTASAMLFQHAYQTPLSLAEAAVEVPPPLAALVDRLMARDPAARYQSCEEVLTDLARWRAGEPPAAARLRTEEGRAPRRRRRLLIAAALAAVLLVPGGLFFALKPRPAGTPPADIPPAGPPPAFGPSLAQLPSEQIKSQPSIVPGVNPRQTPEKLYKPLGKAPSLLPQKIGSPKLVTGAVITAAVFSPDGTRILLADTRLHLWEWKRNKLQDFGIRLSGPIRAADWSHDGRRILVGGAETSDGKRFSGVAMVFEAATGRLVAACRGHRTPVCAVAFSGDGKEILTAGEEPSENSSPLPPGADPKECTAVYRWDPTTGKLLNRYLGPVKPVRSIAFTAGRERIYAAGSAEDPILYSWDTKSAKAARIPIPTRFRSYASLSPDASKMIIVDNTARFILYQVWEDNPLKELRRSWPLTVQKDDKQAVPVPRCPTWSRDDSFVVFSSTLSPQDPRKAPLYFTRPYNGEVLFELTGHQAETRVLAVSHRVRKVVQDKPAEVRFVFSSGKDGDHLVSVIVPKGGPPKRFP